VKNQRNGGGPLLATSGCWHSSKFQPGRCEQRPSSAARRSPRPWPGSPRTVPRSGRRRRRPASTPPGASRRSRSPSSAPDLRRVQVGEDAEQCDEVELQPLERGPGSSSFFRKRKLGRRYFCRQKKRPLRPRCRSRSKGRAGSGSPAAPRSGQPVPQPTSSTRASGVSPRSVRICSFQPAPGARTPRGSPARRCSSSRRPDRPSSRGPRTPPKIPHLPRGRAGRRYGRGAEPRVLEPGGRLLHQVEFQQEVPRAVRRIQGTAEGDLFPPPDVRRQRRAPVVEDQASAVGEEPVVRQPDGVRAPGRPGLRARVPEAPPHSWPPAPISSTAGGCRIAILGLQGLHRRRPAAGAAQRPAPGHGLYDRRTAAFSSLPSRAGRGAEMWGKFPTYRCEPAGWKPAGSHRQVWKLAATRRPAPVGSVHAPTLEVENSKDALVRVRPASRYR